MKGVSILPSPSGRGDGGEGFGLMDEALTLPSPGGRGFYNDHSPGMVKSSSAVSPASISTGCVKTRS
jgi:hypothetical protein